MTGDWTRDDVLVWFTAEEWEEITSALRNRAPTSPGSSVNPHSDGGKPTPKPGKDLPAGGAAPLPEDAGTAGAGEGPAVPSVYEGTFPLSWLREEETVQPAGEGSGACYVQQPLGAGARGCRVDLGDTVDRLPEGTIIAYRAVPKHAEQESPYRDMQDLRERCEKAARTLAELIRHEQDRARIDHLQSKRSGVLLVLDYMRAYPGDRL